MDSFELSGDFIELNKLLKASGACSSGGEASAAIAGGSVAVNGAAESRKRRKLRKGDLVEFAGRKIAIT